MPRGWGSTGTATLIRDLLMSMGESYPKEIHRLLKDKIEAMGYRPPSYQSVRTMFYVLRKLGLIRFIREARAPSRGLFNKRFYGVTPGRERDPRWRSPHAALYDPARFRRGEEFRRSFARFPEEWFKKIKKF